MLGLASIKEQAFTATLDIPGDLRMSGSEQTRVWEEPEAIPFTTHDKPIRLVTEYVEPQALPAPTVGEVTKALLALVAVGVVVCIVLAMMFS